LKLLLLLPQKPLLLLLPLLTLLLAPPVLLLTLLPTLPRLLLMLPRLLLTLLLLPSNTCAAGSRFTGSLSGKKASIFGSRPFFMSVARPCARA